MTQNANYFLFTLKKEYHVVSYQNECSINVRASCPHPTSIIWKKGKARKVIFGHLYLYQIVILSQHKSLRGIAVAWLLSHEVDVPIWLFHTQISLLVLPSHISSSSCMSFYIHLLVLVRWLIGDMHWMNIWCAIVI